MRQRQRDNLTLMACIQNTQEPSTFEEAEEEKFWKEAMDEEYTSLIKNNTWNLVELLKGKKPIGVKWVYKIKYNSEGEIGRYKGRLVEKCYVQKERIDYDKNFVPITKIYTIRMVFSLVTIKDWTIHQMDVKFAFLQGEINE